MRDVTAYVLAGGQSTRMGEDKAFIQVGGVSLIEHALGRLKPLDCDIFIVGPRNKFNAFGRVLEDRFPDSGPLAGIHRALERSDTDLSLITPVDTPLVPWEFFEDLLEAARATRVEAVVARTRGGLHPLCAVYRKSFLKPVEEALEGKRFKVDKVFQGRPHLLFDAEAHGYSSSLFLNINAPADLRSAELTLGGDKKNTGVEI